METPRTWDEWHDWAMTLDKWSNAEWWDTIADMGEQVTLLHNVRTYLQERPPDALIPASRLLRVAFGEEASSRSR